MTRVESGLSGRLSQRARASRRPVDCGAAGDGVDAGRPRVEHREISRLDRLLLAVARNHRRRRDRPNVGRRQHRVRRNRPQGVVTLERFVQLVPPGFRRPLEQRRYLVVLEGDLPKRQGTELPLQQRPIRLGLGQDRLDLVGELGDRAGGPLVAIGPFEGIDLAEDVGRRFLPGGAFRLILGPLPRRGQRQVVAGQERREERLEPVIVLLQDRVELVVVAAGTADAQPEEDLARDVGDVIQDVGPLPAHVALVVFVGAQPEVAGRHSQLGIVGIELVAGKLLGQEAVVGFVGVEGPDDIVAVTPGVGAERILPVAVRLGIAHEVEPVPPPALAVTRRGQQAVDQSLVGVRRRSSARNASTSSGVGGKPVRSKVTRRIKVGLSASAAGVRPWLRRAWRMNRRWGFATSRPSLRIRDRPVGNDRSANGLERPDAPGQAAVSFDPCGSVAAARGMCRAIAAGPGSTQRDPAGEDGDFLRAELAVGGHLEPLVVDRLDDQALLGLAGHDRRSRLAPFENRLQRVEPQAPFLLLVAVARVAFLGEQRPDVLLEEVLAGGLGGGVGLAGTSTDAVPSRTQRQAQSRAQ